MTVSSVSPTNLAIAADLHPASRGVQGEAPARVQAASSIAATEQRPVQQEPASRREVEEAVQKVVKFVEPLKNQLQFSVDDQSGQLLVKVIDQATKEVIRQIPSEEMVSIANALDRLQGLLVRQSA